MITVMFIKKDFKFRKGVLKGLNISLKNYYIFLITNQAGIAKDITKRLILKLHIYLKISYQKIIYILTCQYCPFHPKGKIKRYKRKSFKKTR